MGSPVASGGSLCSWRPAGEAQIPALLLGERSNVRCSNMGTSSTSLWKRVGLLWVCNKSHCQSDIVIMRGTGSSGITIVYLLLSNALCHLSTANLHKKQQFHPQKRIEPRLIGAGKHTRTPPRKSGSGRSSQAQRRPRAAASASPNASRPRTPPGHRCLQVQNEHLVQHI